MFKIVLILAIFAIASAQRAPIDDLELPPIDDVIIRPIKNDRIDPLPAPEIPRSLQPVLIQPSADSTAGVPGKVGPINFKILNFNDVNLKKRELRTEPDGAPAKIAASSSLWFSEPVRSASAPIIQKSASGTFNKDEVRAEVFSWWTQPIGRNLEDYNNKVKEDIVVDNSTHKCVEATYQYSHPSYTTMNIDQQMASLWPGSFIQGKSIKTGAQALQRIPISANDRYPIQIDSLYGFIAEATPTADSVITQIRNRLKAQQTDVFVGFATTKNISLVFQALDFNARVAEKLGISKFKNSRIFVIMHQILNEYSPAMFVKDNSIFEDPIGVFFKDSFDITKALSFKNFLFWGPNNIPTYVKRVYYGRFLAISVDESPRNIEIIKKINEGVSQQEKTKLFKNMFSDTSVLAYGKGPFSEIETQQVKTGNWDSFFGDLPPLNNSTRSRVSPIAYSLNDLRDQPVRFSNAIKYLATTCEAKPPVVVEKPQHRIFIQLLDMYWQAAIEISKNGAPFWRFLYLTGSQSSGVLQITDHLSNSEFVRDQIRVDSTVHRRCFFCISWRRVRARIWIDAVDDAHQVANIESGCERCHSNSQAIKCSINKMKGEVYCWTN